MQDVGFWNPSVQDRTPHRNGVCILIFRIFAAQSPRPPMPLSTLRLHLTMPLSRLEVRMDSLLPFLTLREQGGIRKHSRLPGRNGHVVRLSGPEVRALSHDNMNIRDWVQPGADRSTDRYQRRVLHAPSDPSLPLTPGISDKAIP